MKSHFTLLILLAGLTLSLARCTATNDAEKFADRFFSAILNHNFKQAEGQLDSSLLGSYDISSLAENPQDGKLLTAKKGFGFSTNISNGITTVELPYELKFQNGTYPVQVVIIDRGNGFKISSIY